jgi:hypothetical protein
VSKSAKAILVVIGSLLGICVALVLTVWFVVMPRLGEQLLHNGRDPAFIAKVVRANRTV